MRPTSPHSSGDDCRVRTYGPGATRLYLDQNYLSGIAKRKPTFDELAPVLREAVITGAVQVLESDVHELESKPRPDLKLMELLHELSHGRRLPDHLDRPAREIQRCMAWVTAHELPERTSHPSDQLELRHRVELFSGRRRDVLRLRDRIRELNAPR